MRKKKRQGETVIILFSWVLTTHLYHVIFIDVTFFQVKNTSCVNAIITEFATATWIVQLSTYQLATGQR